MKKIRKGDDVMVLTGRNKSARGKVLRVLDDERLIVEGVNLIKRHTRPNPQVGQPGGIIEREASIHVSNVAIFNAGTGKADRVGFKTLQDGRKVRVFKSNGEVVDI
jgi:large subunit ribosomal protein L24